MSDPVGRGAAETAGWQADGSYVPCSACRWTPPPDSGAPGVALHVLPRTPGTATHRGDCPRVQLLTPQERRDLFDKLDEMDRVRRRGAAEAAFYVIG